MVLGTPQHRYELDGSAIKKEILERTAKFRPCRLFVPRTSLAHFFTPFFWSLFDQSNSTWVLQGEKMVPTKVPRPGHWRGADAIHEYADRDDAWCRCSLWAFIRTSENMRRRCERYVVRNVPGRRVRISSWPRCQRQIEARRAIERPLADRAVCRFDRRRGSRSRRPAWNSPSARPRRK